MDYLQLEKAFEIIIRRNGNADDILAPIKHAMDKSGFSIIETQPIQRKECIHFKCNTCGFEGEQQYKNLIRYKPKCNCVIDISKKVVGVDDITSIKKYRLLFEKSNITLVLNQNFTDKRITSQFQYTCRVCNHLFEKTLDELGTHVKKFTGHKGCENCAKNDTQVYLSLEDAFKIIFERESTENIIPPLKNAMDRYNFSIAVDEPITTKEKIQYKCNVCHHKGTASFYNLIRKGDCRKCNGHTGGGPKPIIVKSFQDVLNIPEYKALFDATNYILSDKNFETPKTISSTFYFKCKECDYEIGPNLLSYIKTCLQTNPLTNGCVGCKKKDLVKTSDKCECGTIVKFCMKCGGSGLCKHGSNKYACSISDCRQKYTRYCSEHDKLITSCRICGHRYFCKHDVFKYRCKECNYEGYMATIIRSRVNTEIKRHHLAKDKHSIEYLGCTIEHLMKVFINYYGIDELDANDHIDHIKPISKFNLSKSDDVYQAFHWTNLQPLNAVKNRIKSNTWSDELDEWWHREVQLKLELYPFDTNGVVTKEYKSYTRAPDKFTQYSNFLSTNEDLTVISTVDSLRETQKFVFKCNKCNTTHTLAQASFGNKMGMLTADDFCSVCHRIKCDQEKFDETKKEIFNSTGHILLTCDFGGDRKCTYECGKCKFVGSTNYFNLKTNTGECPKCRKTNQKNDLENVTQTVNALGFDLLTTKSNYTNNKNLLVQCKCKKYPCFNISLADLKRGRRKCSH